MRQPPETLERGWLDDLDLLLIRTRRWCCDGSPALPHPNTTPLLLRSRAPLGAGHDLLGQRGIVAIEVMATGGLDPLGPVELRRGAGGILFVRAVEALDQGRIQLRDLGQDRARTAITPTPSQSVT